MTSGDEARLISNPSNLECQPTLRTCPTTRRRCVECVQLDHARDAGAEESLQPDFAFSNLRASAALRLGSAFWHNRNGQKLITCELLRRCGYRFVCLGSPGQRNNLRLHPHFRAKEVNDGTDDERRDRSGRDGVDVQDRQDANGESRKPSDPPSGVETRTRASPVAT